MPMYQMGVTSPRTWPAATDPLVTSDTAAGYRVGDIWVNTATGNIWDAYDVTAGAAKWRFRPRVLAASGVALTVPVNTTENTLVTVTIPANAMGASGIIRISTNWSYTNGADDKAMVIRFGGASGTRYLWIIATTTLGMQSPTIIQNRTTGTQVGFASGNSIGYGTTGSSPTTSSVDTTAATTLVITGQKETAGDSQILESYLVELLRPDIT